ncbi:hypothetical protein Pmani_013403 [Petrolisthes manimaculis]|uniref:SCP domain-containing protein n=1 Tax=Petrolisthes manimaculis TaxID=1843537 RepID=A0AAE1PWA2_9EUCA|nr:hypothetical protein Pmani_013403 [Petrolisthes manimaculis]
MRLNFLRAMMVLVMALAVIIDASPVPDMMQLLRESDIQNQLEHIDKLVRKVAGDTDPAAQSPPVIEAARKAEAIKSQLSEIDELMHQVMNLTNCMKRPITDQKEQGQHPGGEHDTSPPAPTTTPTTTSPTPEGDCDWASLSPDHTMLIKANTKCEITNMGLLNPGEKELILKIHNDFRSKVARGEENRGKPGPQPPAADMLELVWSDQLAKVAQAWANQCPHGHDEAKNRGVCGAQYPVGQNIYYYWGFAVEPRHVTTLTVGLTLHPPRFRHRCEYFFRRRFASDTLRRMLSISPYYHEEVDFRIFTHALLAARQQMTSVLIKACDTDVLIVTNWEGAIEEWYDEVEYMPNTIADSFMLLDTHRIGHYTQVVWAETREVGCGVVYYEATKQGSWFPNSKTYVCNYGTAGNVKTRPMYTQGPHASKCPNGVSQNYPALCA